MTERNKPNEFYLTRLYDAPVRAVWDAWTDPARVAKWWGPRGFTLTTHSKDLRPGGHWAYTMHGPDGVDYENKTVYHEVEECAKLVYDHGGNDDRPPLFRVTVLFSEEKGKTRMEMTFAMESAEAVRDILKFIKKAGGESTWDRLGEYLGETHQNQGFFLINRSFQAPLETVFSAWTDPKQICQWLPPTGFTMEFLKADIRPGGSSLYCMTDGGATKMYGRAQYVEVQRPDRIVYTQEFCDEKGNLSRHPHAPTWPATMLTTVTLASEGANRTRVTVKWEVHGMATAAEVEFFLKSRGGMTQGWTGSFDKLEEYLVRRG